MVLWCEVISLSLSPSLKVSTSVLIIGAMWLGLYMLCTKQGIALFNKLLAEGRNHILLVDSH
jgi:hypothetical protein